MLVSLDTLTTESIHAITTRAVEKGRIPSPDACDAHGQPLLTWEAFATLFGLTPEQAQAEEAEEAEFFQHLAEVAYLGPIRSALEEGTVNSRG